MVVALHLVTPLLLGSNLKLVGIPFANGAIGHDAFPILKSYRIDQDELLNPVGKHERETRGEHAAHGMTDDTHILDSKAIKKGTGIYGKLLEAELVMPGL